MKRILLTGYLICFSTAAVAQMSDYDRGYAAGHSAGYAAGYVAGSGAGNVPLAQFKPGFSVGEEGPDFIAIDIETLNGLIKIRDPGAVPIYGSIDNTSPELWSDILGSGLEHGWVEPRQIMLVPQLSLDEGQNVIRVPVWDSQTGELSTLAGPAADFAPMLNGLDFNSGPSMFSADNLNFE